MIKKLIGVSLTAIAMLPGLASAAAYSTTTAGTDFASSLSDIGILIGAGVAAALGGWAALTGLGFALRHFKRYVSGKKF